MPITEGKKRGRKTKAEKAAAEAAALANPQPLIPHAPKKRGRKPKGGKIVQHLSELPKPVELSPNVILHLKCSLNDIGQNYSDKLLDSHDFCSTKSNELNFHIISQPELIVEENNTKNNICMSATNSTHKEIDSKLRILEKNLHFNTIPNKKSACFWCTCDFDNPAVYIPKFQIKDQFQVYGNFCSPECAAAHLFNEDIDTSSKFERYQSLNYLYGKIYNYQKKIKPAPHPHYILDKFYGNLSIQEYRKLSQNNNLLLIIDKPLTRVLPELHEDNDDFLLSNNNVTSSSLKLKRNYNIPSKNDILSENFGM